MQSGPHAAHEDLVVGQLRAAGHDRRSRHRAYAEPGSTSRRSAHARGAAARVPARMRLRAGRPPCCCASPPGPPSAARPARHPCRSTLYPTGSHIIGVTPRTRVRGRLRRSEEGRRQGRSLLQGAARARPDRQDPTHQTLARHRLRAQCDWYDDVLTAASLPERLRRRHALNFFAENKGVTAKESISN